MHGQEGGSWHDGVGLRAGVWLADTDPKLYAYRTPATPAMNELIVKPAVFARRTSTPIDAAARSLDRTATMR